MNIVVDANILFTFFWKDSVLRNILLKSNVKLFSPEYALEEINKYSSYIVKKANLSKEEFKKIKEQIALYIEFIPLKEYQSFFKDFESIFKNFSETDRIEFLKDIDYLALSLKLNHPLWSNDKLLKSQSIIIVFTTKEIIELLTNES